MKLVVFQIDVVDDLGDLAQTFALRQTELLQYRLERAVCSVVGELGYEHIEGNGSFDSFSVSHEIEAWTPINELFDQPGRSQPVNVQIAARHPALTLILCNVECSAFLLRLCSFHGGTLGRPDSLLAPFIGSNGGGSPPGIKKVIGSNALKLSMQLVDFSLMRR